MRYQVLTVGTDLALLTTRQAVLASCGYDSVIVAPEGLDATFRSGKFDLVILSAMLSEQEKRRILGGLPSDTRPMVLETFVRPEELLEMVSEALR